MSLNTGNVSGGSGATAAYYQNLNAKKGGAGAAAKATADAAGDQYTAGNASASKGVYSKETALQKFQGLADARYASMRGAVASMIGGLTGSTPSSGQNGQAFWAMAANNNNANFGVDKATQAKAQELTGEDGYFGIKKTTDRIVEFAKALAGSGASEKTIENLRKGVQQGFDYVADLFGGFDKLPQLSKDTYTSVMKEFDSWASGTKVSGS